MCFSEQKFLIFHSLKSLKLSTKPNKHTDLLVDQMKIVYFFYSSSQ